METPNKITVKVFVTFSKLAIMLVNNDFARPRSSFVIPPTELSDQ